MLRVIVECHLLPTEVPHEVASKACLLSMFTENLRIRTFAYVLEFSFPWHLFSLSRTVIYIVENSPPSSAGLFCNHVLNLAS